MAYISTEEVKKIRQEIKKEFSSKDGWKFSIRTVHYSKIIVAILESKLNLDPEKKGHYQVNEFWIDKHYENQPVLKNVFNTIKNIITGTKDHNDRNAGDMGADYPAWNYHMSIYVGKWDKPFQKINK